jgi:hypothetical protein
MEIWKEVKGYEGLYEVSNLGRVKSLSRIVLKCGKNPFITKEIILKNYIGNGKYLMVRLSNNGKAKTKRIHQLVAISFLNHNPCGHKLVVNHIDFDRLNNKAENLEIITARENGNQKHLKSTSKYTGVSWDNNKKKWSSNIYVNGKTRSLGRFDTEIEASNYYENALISIKNNSEIIKKEFVTSSKYKGVYWHKKANKWASQIRIKNVRKNLGLFISEIEANNAYQNALNNII